MHELLLYGQVPPSRHEQVLKILAGVAAMQPRRILQRHIVYKPLREPEEPGSNLRRGGSQAVAVKQQKQTPAKDLNFSKLIQQLSEREFGHRSNGPPSSTKPDSTTGPEPKWSLVFNETPDTSDKGVTVRFAHTTDILSGDPHAYQVANRHTFVTEFYMEGHRYVHGNVVIFLHRPLQESGVRPQQQAPKDILPTLAALEPVDPSGYYLLEAKIRVQDLNDLQVLEAGVNELKRFQAQMKGCVELAAPERLSLDTRVKYKPKTT